MRAFVVSFAGPAPDVAAQRVTLPAPGGEPALRELAARFVAERPEQPWLAADPVDGGAHLLVEGDPADLDAGDGGGPGLVPQLVLGAMSLPWRALGAVRHPDRAIGGAFATGERLLGAATSRLWPRPDTPYSGGGPRVAWTRLDLDRLAPLLDAPGGGLEDLLASAVSRALRDDLDRLGHDGDAGDANDLARQALVEVDEAPPDAEVDGHEPREVRPLPFPREGAGVALAALRDDEGVTVGIVAPDPEALATALDDAIAELLETVEAPAPPAARTPPAPVAPLEDVEPIDFDAPPDPLPGEAEPVVETPTEMVAEVADPGAEDGAGAQVRVAEPWDGYAELTAAQVVERLAHATPEELAVVAMYERLHRGRATVVEAAERGLNGR